MVIIFFLMIQRHPEPKRTYTLFPYTPLFRSIPAPGCLQFHQWMSPRISERLSRWYLPRYAARGVYERMAKHRVDFLTDGVWQSLSADAPFCLRNHRVA